MNKSYSKYILFILRTFLGLFFILSSINKLIDPESFAVSIANYKIVPLFIINIFAIILPWIEFVAGLLLVFGIKVKENAFLINSMLVVFNVMILIAILRGLDIDCGCFGTAHSQKVGFMKLFENFILLIIGLIIQFNGSQFLSLSGNNENR